MNETKTNRSFMMTDEDFTDYFMQMHFMTYEQKLLFLKELVNTLQKDYVKPSFIVTSQAELEAKLDEALNDPRPGIPIDEAFKQIRESVLNKHSNSDCKN
jgi:hypothetical protein